MLGVDETGAPGLLVAPCYTGSAGDPKELRTLRAAPGLVEDGVRAQTFLDQQLIFDSPYGENRHYWKGNFVDELPDESIRDLLESVTAFGRSASHVLIESLHGAPKDADATQGADRLPSCVLQTRAPWRSGGIPRSTSYTSSGRATTALAMEPWSTGGGYANYMQADEPHERVRAAFGGEAFERLQQLKKRYDPGNVLRRNQNIPPPGGEVNA